LLNRHPGAKILDPFSREAAGHSGPAFDLQWVNAGGAEQSARVAFIPSLAGVLEFGLLTTADKFPGGKAVFDSLLAGFQSNEGGLIGPLQHGSRSS